MLKRALYSIGKEEEKNNNIETLKSGLEVTGGY